VVVILAASQPCQGQDGLSLGVPGDNEEVARRARQTDRDGPFRADAKARNLDQAEAAALAATAERVP
jgi:hypothetical protein